MLKYFAKLNASNITKEVMVWGEKYLAPDLSFVSGVTSQDYHLEKFNRLAVTNSIMSTPNSVVSVESRNVTRQGYITIKEKEYEVVSSSIVDYSVESSGTPITYKYLFVNGKYYYATKENEESQEEDTFFIKDWLVEKFKEVDGIVKPIIVEEDIKAKIVDSVVKLDTIVWIEDGVVSIDGYNYIFDKNAVVDASTKGGIKYLEDGKYLEANEITKCSEIVYHPFELTSDYIHVTKFVLTKPDELKESFEKISHCKRFYYVKYKNNYLPITLEENAFICNIPNYVLGLSKEVTESEYYETVPYDVYGADKDENDEPLPLTGETFDTLFYEESYVVIDNEVFNVEYDVMNANSGREIAIYLDGETSNIEVGDKVRLIDSSETSHTQYVYTIDSYGFNEDDTNFVLFNGRKYKVEENICDKVLINEYEYTIDYINGKVEGKDCLVWIGEEKVPMKIKKVGNDFKLERYGRIITNGAQPAVVATYDIVPYDGITVDDKRYIIKEEVVPPISTGGETEKHYFAVLDRSNEYTFIVGDIKGSSLIICRPDINTTDFTDDFNIFISEEICRDVVENESDMILYTKNKVFGSKEITEELAFQADIYRKPISSDEYYDLFSSFEVYVRNGYISFPLKLSAPQGTNIMQDDLLNAAFEEKKKEAINPIVDMEKDVYTPKFIRNSRETVAKLLGKTSITDEEWDEYINAYIGSYTEFYPIEQIRVNLHFRTRNIDSWKVNDENNDISVSDMDNWFITDYYPYKDMLSTDDETLIETSDLLGLMNFTNNDVFYQKSNIAKSFLRFSHYDSTNPQTQSLLATSAVFMDEHALFKKYIDNSRKNIEKYKFVNFDEEAYKNTAPFNRISVDTEHIIKKTCRDDDDECTVEINEDKRMSSRFIIDNKFNTETSSEGYYLYIFREYSENLHPKPIYLKVEFNHAGIGHTIPFIIPMKWGEANEDGDMYPTERLTLSSTDIDELKEGVRLNDLYAQSYIPIYAVYDFINKEYAYVFDDRYVDIEEDDAITYVNLNLFELKIMDESETTDTTESEAKDVTLKRQKRAVINNNFA